jgi:hypothetical protein
MVKRRIAAAAVVDQMAVACLHHMPAAALVATIRATHGLTSLANISSPTWVGGAALRVRVCGGKGERRLQLSQCRAHAKTSFDLLQSYRSCVWRVWEPPASPLQLNA